MLPNLVRLLSFVASFWLIRRDIGSRNGVSGAIWIPTLWFGILVSRPLSMWLGIGGGQDSLEGSPLDRMFYFGMIFAALFVLMRRPVDWGTVFRANWPVMLFYAFMLLSVLWAADSFVSFKRWFKEVGNVFVALVILTEVNPQEAFRAVFVRAAYFLMPLSIVFLRYFPNLGRRYLRGGDLEVIGVTTQKNSLGILVLTCGIALIWDWFERKPPGMANQTKADRYVPIAFFLMGAYLLHLCDSKTSIVCLMLAVGLLSASRLPALGNRIRGIGTALLITIPGFFILDSVFSIKATLLTALGRDATLTGRTEVWRELLALKTDPVIGTGFCSFWSDKRYLSRLPDWVAASAHNGYLETYIDGGYTGMFFLAVMLLVLGLRAHRRLSVGENYSLVSFAIFLVIIIGDVSESHFGRMSPLAFMFLASALQCRVSAPVGIQDGLGPDTLDISTEFPRSSHPC